MPVDRVSTPEERMSRADMWEAGADERERIADEREQLADERDLLLDEREPLADRHDLTLDRREAYALAAGGDEEAELVALDGAVRRAQARVRAAQAELQRIREAAARVEARAALRRTALDRAEEARNAAHPVDVEELEWLADRRDFVAAERDVVADARDAIADLRDDDAGLRERGCDDRERAALDRERQAEERRLVRRPRDARPSDDDHVRRSRQREDAASNRRAAARDRGRAAETWGPQECGPMLVASFSEVAGELARAEDLTGALRRALKFTVDAVPGCDSAAITLWRHGRTVDSLSSDALAEELDEIQFGTGIGPGFEALSSETPVYAPRLADSPRWPVLAATARDLGIASAVGHGLFVRHPAQWSALGVLTLYGRTRDAFSDDDLEVGSILAAFLAAAVATAHRREDVERREAALHRGLSTRDVIGQAKGILMERQRLSAGEAFDVLRRASQALNRKLADVADHLAETGELPT